MSWVVPSFNNDDDASAHLSKRIRVEEYTPHIDHPLNICEIPVNHSSKKQIGPLLDRYVPEKHEDLAVQPKKLHELNGVLKKLLQNTNGGKFCLLIGPTGCGKTASLRVLCKSLNVKIIEWINPLDLTTPYYEANSKLCSIYQSQIEVFESFLTRASRYNNVLQLNQNTENKIIVVKDFPNVFIYNPSSFHDVMKKMTYQCLKPVVFICSDINICRNLFPDSLKVELKIHEVKFNPIVETALCKTLNKIVQNEKKLNPGISILPSDVVLGICQSCDGDIRSAVLKLNFILADPSKSSDAKAVTYKKGRHKKKGRTVEKDKDKKVDLFRGIGRVLYPKKQPLSPNPSTVESNAEHSYKLVYSADSIADMFLDKPTVFVSFLQENYLNTFSDIKDVTLATDRLLVADTFFNEWHSKELFAKYGLWTAIQGLMVSNSKPITTFRPVTKPRTYRAENDSKINLDDVRKILPDRRETSREVVLDVLSYLTIIPYCTQIQLDFVTKATRF